MRFTCIPCFATVRRNVKCVVYQCARNFRKAESLVSFVEKAFQVFAHRFNTKLLITSVTNPSQTSTPLRHVPKRHTRAQTNTQIHAHAQTHIDNTHTHTFAHRQHTHTHTVCVGGGEREKRTREREREKERERNREGEQNLHALCRNAVQCVVGWKHVAVSICKRPMPPLYRLFFASRLMLARERDLSSK